MQRAATGSGKDVAADDIGIERIQIARRAERPVRSNGQQCERGGKKGQRTRKNAEDLHRAGKADCSVGEGGKAEADRCAV